MKKQISLIFFVCAGLNLYPQQQPSVARDEKEELILELCSRINRLYVSEEVAGYVCSSLKTNLERGVYNNIGTAEEFASRLDKELQELSRDKHMGVGYNPALVLEMKQNELRAEGNIFLTAEMIEEERYKNYGFRETLIMGGNVGYLDLRFFSHPLYGGETAVSVMQFFSNCDALIIDMRYNGGGWGEMGSLLMSYFFGGDTLVQFGSAYVRSEDRYIQDWSMPYVPGKKLSGVLLYVLTSASTFSAAEAMCSILKSYGRAVIVGDTTRGGGHALDVSYFGDYVFYIPFMVSLNPVTGNSFEGTGIAPDIPAESSGALDIAYKDALINLLAREKNEERKFKIEWALNGLSARINDFQLDASTMMRYAGLYQNRTIFHEKGELFYQYGDRAKGRMTYLGHALFSLEQYDYVRVRFIEEKGVIKGIEEIFDDGRVLFKERTGDIRFSNR